MVKKALQMEIGERLGTRKEPIKGHTLDNVQHVRVLHWFSIFCAYVKGFPIINLLYKWGPFLWVLF